LENEDAILGVVAKTGRAIDMRRSNATTWIRVDGAFSSLRGQRKLMALWLGGGALLFYDLGFVLVQSSH
jgi:hypothetical protein